MNIEQKIDFLMKNHYEVWAKTRQEVENRLSERQTIFCCCGKLATGFHEYNCRKFQTKVNTTTVKELKHLLNGRQQ